MNVLIHLCIVAASMMIAAYALPGFEVTSFGTAFVGAIVLGIVNAVIRPVLKFLTFPINIVTLGLFTFVINGFMLVLVSHVVKGVQIHGWIDAILGSILISVVSVVIEKILGRKEH